MYDIIGDIHGHAIVLESLLKKLGYHKKRGAYKHPERTVIFLGDLIDRGAQQKETLDIVFAMIDAGSAVSVMGNHEYNAILFATEGESGYLRAHTSKNIEQHKAFLATFPFGSKAHSHTIERLKELPVYLDLDSFRCIHACWHQASIDHLEPLLNKDNTLPDSLLTSIEGSDICNAIEVLLKGPEVNLPESVSFDDAQGFNRTKSRLNWWLDETSPIELKLSLGDIVYNKEKLAGIYIDTFPPYKHTYPSVFFGHYWLNGEPAGTSVNTACLDYSVTKNGYLVAYRWDGNPLINPLNFVFI